MNLCLMLIHVSDFNDVETDDLLRRFHLLDFEHKEEDILGARPEE